MEEFEDTETAITRFRVMGTIGAYVDDFLVAGQEGNAQWDYVVSEFQKAFRGAPWECWRFKQTGLSVKQDSQTFEIELSQNEYLDSLEEIAIPSHRKGRPEDDVTEAERTALRGLLGGLQWLCTQTRMDLCAEVGLLQSCVTKARVRHLEKANKILRRAKKHAEKTTLKIRRIDGDVICIGWSDASLKNRIDSSSTGGYVIGFARESICQGQCSHVTPVAWRSYKLRRVAISSLSAETQALRTMEDELYMTRMAWAEFQGQRVNIHEPDEHVKTVAGLAIIDAKAIFDGLSGKDQVQNMIEKRTAIELLAYLHDTARDGTRTQWVHGEANLADSLTKDGAERIILEFMEKSTWLIVHDEHHRSAKRRKRDKLGRLEENPEQEEGFLTAVYVKLSRDYPDMFQEEDSEEDDRQSWVTDDEDDIDPSAEYPCSANNNFRGV